jgi:hypothetical protein
VTKRAIFRIDPRDEQGATLAIVAISLLAIFGMVVLTVDLGALLVKRRGMVNSSDSAALAAAETFARGLAHVGVNEGPAQMQADLLATQNMSNAVRDSFAAGPYPDPAPPTCSGGPNPTPCGQVSVQYHGNQSLFFAPLLGIGQVDVRAAATAIWGPAGGGHVIPLMVTEPALRGCGFPNGPPSTPPPRCKLQYDSADLGHAQWGLIDLGNWNVNSVQNPDPKGVCRGASQEDTRRWLNDPPLETLNAPPSPTYVCNDRGLEDVADDIPSGIRNFAVIDPNRQIPPDPNPKKNTRLYYDVIGFVPLRIISVDQNRCEASPLDEGQALCLTVEYTGPIAGGILPGGGNDFGLEAVRLSA